MDMPYSLGFGISLLRALSFELWVANPFSKLQALSSKPEFQFFLNKTSTLVKQSHYFCGADNLVLGGRVAWGKRWFQCKADHNKYFLCVFGACQRTVHGTFYPCMIVLSCIKFARLPLSLVVIRFDATWAGVDISAHGDLSHYDPFALHFIHLILVFSDFLRISVMFTAYFLSQ